MEYYIYNHVFDLRKGKPWWLSAKQLSGPLKRLNSGVKRANMLQKGGGLGPHLTPFYRGSLRRPYKLIFVPFKCHHKMRVFGVHSDLVLRRYEVRIRQKITSYLLSLRVRAQFFILIRRINPRSKFCGWRC